MRLRRTRGRRATRLLRICALVALGSSLATCGRPSPDRIARGEALFGGCTPCHGPEGEGGPALGAPSIAGLPAWYVRLQIWEFRVGYRGYVSADSAGARMATAVAGLADRADAAALAAWVAGLPAVAPPPVLGGDPARGKVAYQACVACHRRDGSGREDKLAPPISGLADWYVAGQLRKFRDGWRGANRNDVPGATMMRPVSIPLSDQDILDLAAYVPTLGRPGR